MPRTLRRKKKDAARTLRREVGGFLLAAAAVLVALLWLTGTGVAGHYLVVVARWTVGRATLPLLAFVFLLGARQSLGLPPDPRLKTTGLVLLVLLPAAAAALWPARLGGGMLGFVVAFLLLRAVGEVGRTFVLAVAFVLTAMLWVEDLPRRLLAFVRDGVPARLRGLARWLDAYLYEEVPQPEAAPPPEPEPLPTDPPVRDEVPPVRDPEPAAEPPTPVRRPLPRRERVQGRFLLPSLDLLRPANPQRRAAREGSEKARLLEETLASFGVHVRVLEAVEGPVVTRFELQPAPGVKVSRIVSLADDIALAMAATDVRIEAPIPGKSALGIEIPNNEAAPVLLRDVIDSEAFRSAQSPLTVALGKDISGRPVVAALDRMPHLLIAGATGSGKSVCLNSIILSLIFRNVPDDVRLLLIDPKVVELQPFDGIPHLYAPLVTDPRKAAGVLRRMVREMEARYHRFAEVGVRDLERYNEVAEEHLPKIVIIIDELADLMMVAPVDVEDAICRLAQMARAAGIHLVVATQRPSVDVITGLIKANIPSRIAFAVSSQVDSRTILDQAGAEKLLGKGDMLFAPLGRAKPLRAQGCFVDDSEVESVTAFWRAQAAPDFGSQDLLAEELPAEEERDQLDELFKDAVRVVMDARQASASLLQRRLRVGYARAARLVEQMEARGLVGPQDGSRPREVRITPAEYERLFGADDRDVVS